MLQIRTLLFIFVCGKAVQPQSPEHARHTVLKTSAVLNGSARDTEALNTHLMSIATLVRPEEVSPIALGRSRHGSASNVATSHDLLRTLCVPSFAVAFGFSLHSKAAYRTFAMFVIFFGAQVFMNLYMKEVISASPISEAQGMIGFPAPFVLTALQLITAFLLLSACIVLSWATPWPYCPRPITKRDIPAIVGLALAFTCNISLNNMSLTMIDVSLNQVIRSGGPVGILLMSRVQAFLLGKPKQTYENASYVFLLGAIVFAAWTIVIKSEGQNSDDSSPMLVTGVVICIFSVICSASNMLVVNALNTDFKLNCIDSVFYMSIPSSLMLVLPSVFVPHMVPWDQVGSLTDFQILAVAWRVRPAIIGLACTSGVFSLVYNIFMYRICQQISAMAIEVASNFNKAATIGLAIGTGLEAMEPSGLPRLMASVCGNILCVTAFGLTEHAAKAERAARAERAAKEKMEIA